MTTSNPVVLAVGQSWNELGFEEKVLAGKATLIDGRKLDADDPVWKEAAVILLGTQYKLDAERLKAISGGKLKGVIRYGIGYDNVDAAAAGRCWTTRWGASQEPGQVREAYEQRF